MEPSPRLRVLLVWKACTGRVICKGNDMNMDQIEGKWKQIKGAAKEKWGELTDDDLDRIDGKRDQLIGKVQERYGHAKAAAEKEVDDWLSKI